MALRAGVVAVQGDVAEHAAAVRRAYAPDPSGASADAGEPDASAGPDVVEVREAAQVPDCDALLLPGGESTTISRHLRETGVDEEIRGHVADGKPLLATCAGLIVAAADAKDDRVATLDLLDVSVDRNDFGRQADSFETDLAIAGLDEPFPAVFIRAPAVDRVGDEVEVLAAWKGRPVAVRQGPVVGTAFHPELTGDARVHDLAFGRAATTRL